MIHATYIFSVFGVYYLANFGSKKFNLFWSSLLALSIFIPWLLPLPFSILSLAGLYFLIRQKHPVWRLFTILGLIWFLFDLTLVIENYLFHP